MPLPQLGSPIFKVTLPSTQETISIRPMKVKEEKILLIAKESADVVDIYTAVKQVVNNCLVGFDNFDRITMFDLEYLFLRIRSVSISNVLKLQFKDEEDSKVYDFEVDLDKIALKDNKIPNTIDFNEGDMTIQIVLKYPSAKLYDDRRLLEAKSSVEVLDTLRLGVVDKVKVNGTAESYDEASLKSWLDDVPLAVSNQINEYVGGLPTMYHELNYKNSNGTERRIVLSRLEDFFTLR